MKLKTKIIGGIVMVGGLALLASNYSDEVYLQSVQESNVFEKNYKVEGGQIFQIDTKSGELYPVTRKFQDSFENAESVDDLIRAERWHMYNTDPKRADRADNYYNLGNRVSISKDIAHSGQNSIKFHAKPSTEIASKASIAKGIMYFKKGDTVHFSGWFYLENTPDIYDGGGFTLFDLESGFMDYVGLRIIFRSGDALSFELEAPKTQFRQEKGKEVPFPAGKWVKIETETFLSDENGSVKIWQDGQRVLDVSGRTLPSADTIFDRFEIGISAIAKGAKYEKVLYIDDVMISDAPLR